MKQNAIERESDRSEVRGFSTEQRINMQELKIIKKRLDHQKTKHACWVCRFRNLECQDKLNNENATKYPRCSNTQNYLTIQKLHLVRISV